MKIKLAVLCWLSISLFGCTSAPGPDVPQNIVVVRPRSRPAEVLPTALPSQPAPAVTAKPQEVVVRVVYPDTPTDKPKKHKHKKSSTTGPSKPVSSTDTGRPSIPTAAPAQAADPLAAQFAFLKYMADQFKCPAPAVTATPSPLAVPTLAPTSKPL